MKSYARSECRCRPRVLVWSRRPLSDSTGVEIISERQKRWELAGISSFFVFVRQRPRFTTFTGARGWSWPGRDLKSLMVCALNLASHTFATAVKPRGKGKRHEARRRRLFFRPLLSSNFLMDPPRHAFNVLGPELSILSYWPLLLRNCWREHRAFSPLDYSCSAILSPL